MVEPQDLDILKDIPGYKAIFRALIKSQIQHLVEQLSCHTDEECVLLTASLSDGTLTHLGSNFGKQFLDSHDDVKKQFLGFCLKRQLKTNSSQDKAWSQVEASLSDRTLNNSATRPGSRAKRNRAAASPYANFRQNKHSTTQSKTSVGDNSIRHRQETSNIESAASAESHIQVLKEGIKVELDTNSDEISYTVTEQTGFHPDQFGGINLDSENQAGSTSSDNNVSEEGFLNDSKMAVKLEPVDEDDVELVLTHVEMNAAAGSDWGNQCVIGEQSSENVHDMFIPGGLTMIAQNTSSSSKQLNISNQTQPRSYDETAIVKKLHDGRFQCDICQRVFNRKDYVRKHILIHKGVYPFQCTYCAKVFRQRSQFRHHMALKHGITTVDSTRLLINN